MFYDRYVSQISFGRRVFPWLDHHFYSGYNLWCIATCHSISSLISQEKIYIPAQLNRGICLCNYTRRPSVMCCFTPGILFSCHELITLCNPIIRMSAENTSHTVTNLRHRRKMILPTLATCIVGVDRIIGFRINIPLACWYLETWRVGHYIIVVFCDYTSFPDCITTNN